MKPIYKRVLIKLSGEALMQGFDAKGTKKDGIIDFDFLDIVCKRIKKAVDSGVQVAVVVGGGNIWRGAKNPNFDRVRADYMGMLATTINSIGIQDVLIQNGVNAKVMTAQTVDRAAEAFNRFKAVELLEQGTVVIFGFGLGTPYFSTDTTAVVRAAEIGADMVLFAKNVDGIYDKDPVNNPDAVKYESVTCTEILEKGLKALDYTAAAFAKDNNVEIFAFGLNDPDNIIRALCGENIGTFIKAE